MLLSTAIPAAGQAQAPASLPRHAVHSMEVPGGVASALAAAGATAAPERARFVLELTRRFYNTPKDAEDREAGPLPVLLDHMAFFSRAREATARLDRQGKGLSLAAARDTAGHEAYKQWARALGAEVKGGRKTPRLELPKGRDAVAIRLLLRSAGVEMADVARRLNAGETVTIVLPFERVPLPLAPEVWTSVILQRPVSSEALVAAILSSRPAALTYAGLLALDDATRAWLVGQPELLRWIHQEHPGTFLIAASGLRVASGRVLVPGGEAARPIWEALADQSTQDPERFVRRVLTRDAGRLAYLLSAVASLPAPARGAALASAETRLAARVDEVEAFYATFDAATSDWDREARPFWRPGFDPVSILLALRPSPAHPTGLSGTERFWREVFDADALVPSARDVTRAANDEAPPTLAWLCRQIFDADRQDRRPRADQVMYAARHAARLAAAPVADAMMTLRAVRRVPALVRSLERAGVDDPTVIAALARRAEQLGAIGDDTRAQVAWMQWQGALAHLLAARDDGGLPLDRLGTLLRELAAIAPAADDRFRGALLAWARGWTALPPGQSDPTAGGVADAWAAWAAGRERRVDARVEWEGETYGMDVPATLLARQQKVRGGGVPYVDLAHHVAGAAEALASRELTVEQLRALHARLSPWGALLPPRKDGDALDREIQDRWRDALDDLRKVQRPRDVPRAAEASDALMRVADALLARGLATLAYTRVFAQHDVTPLAPEDAARRHEFGIQRGGDARKTLPWALPEVSTSPAGWRVEGALLALDVTLSESASRRVSTQPPALPPSLNGGDRDTLVDSIVIMPRHALTDADRDGIAAALRRGRERALAAADVASRAEIARAAGMDPAREALWTWVVEEEPERAATWLSPREWLFAGLEGAEPPAAWHAWGVSTQAADGCLCARLVGPLPWDAYAGRMGNAQVAVATPDLHLRLAEHLADLRLPAALAKDVVAAATRDLVDEARAQHQDDWRALLDQVHRVDRDRFEQYLALVTAVGPLRPIDVSQEAPQ